MVVAEEMIRRRGFLARAPKLRSIHQEDVFPTIVVIVQDRNARTSSLDDVALRLFGTIHVAHGDSSLRRNIHEPRWTRMFRTRRINRLHTLSLQTSHQQQPDEDEPHQAPAFFVTPVIAMVFRTFPPSSITYSRFAARFRSTSFFPEGQLNSTTSTLVA